MLSGAEIVMLDAQNNVVAGVSNADVKHNGEGGEQIGYHFWSGAEDPNKASFSVNEEGHLVAKGADIQGSIKVSSMFYGEPIQHDGKLNPNSDTSCIITTAGNYILPQPNLFVGLSYKFFLPATRGMASTTITGSFKETSLEFQQTNKIQLYYGAIECISIGESWLVVRYGDALMEYV
jgi:hypothetical protein